VGASIAKFSKKNVNFIFATHLHKLQELDVIAKLENVVVKHLSCEGNDKQIVYNRKIRDGGGSSLYGLEVAKYLINDNEFIRTAYKIRDKIMEQPSEILATKQSVYNANKFVHQCQVPGCEMSKELDVHHIKFQSSCNIHGMTGHIPKNVKSNLVVLCKSHHLEVHHGDLTIGGYTETTDGLELELRFKMD